MYWDVASQRRKLDMQGNVPERGACIRHLTHLVGAECLAPTHKGHSIRRGTCDTIIELDLAAATETFVRYLSQSLLSPNQRSL